MEAIVKKKTHVKSHFIALWNNKVIGKKKTQIHAVLLHYQSSTWSSLSKASFHFRVSCYLASNTACDVIGSFTKIISHFNGAEGVQRDAWSCIWGHCVLGLHRLD